MDSRRVALRSPVCGTDVFLLDHEPILSPKVHVSDLPARHAPKDLNPDQLGWNQSCYRYTRDTYLNFSGSRGTRTHNGSAAACFQNRFLIRPDDFRLQAAGVGIEPTASWFRARRHYQQQLSRIVRQTKTTSARQGSQLEALRPGIAPDLRASKAHAATTRRRECPAGVEPASPGWKPGTFAARPRAHVVKRKERESNPQGCQARSLSGRLPSPVGLPFRKAAEAGIEPASRRLTAAFPYQHRTHRIMSFSQNGRI